MLGEECGNVEQPALRRDLAGGSSRRPGTAPAAPHDDGCRSCRHDAVLVNLAGSVFAGPLTLVLAGKIAMTFLIPWLNATYGVTFGIRERRIQDTLAEAGTQVCGRPGTSL